MAEVENKFIVINVKDLKYLTEEYREKLFVITKAIEYGRQDEGKKINDYWVCNQDEPYADQIKSIILTGETKKVIPLEPPVSKPVYIVYEACFQGDNLLTAFEDREDAEKYIKRAKKNYYISKPIHVVKAC